jgi:hypothetical protein
MNRFILCLAFVCCSSITVQAGSIKPPHSLFGGTVTQAPEGNVFGVDVGSQIQGEAYFPQALANPKGPCFTAQGCNLTQFSLTISIGGYTYPQRGVTNVPGDTIQLSNGFITSIDFLFPLGPGGLPPFTLSENQFFTASECQVGEVCGTLDFSNSHVVPTPEPPSFVLMTSCILVLAFWYKTRSIHCSSLSGLARSDFADLEKASKPFIKIRDPHKP